MGFSVIHKIILLTYKTLSLYLLFSVLQKIIHTIKNIESSYFNMYCISSIYRPRSALRDSQILFIYNLS